MSNKAGTSTESGPARRRRGQTTAASSSSTTFNCLQCNSTFPNKATLSAHKAIHEEDQNCDYECGQCDKLFTDFISLKRHFYEYHTLRNNRGGQETEGELPTVEGESFLKPFVSLGNRGANNTNLNHPVPAAPVQQVTQPRLRNPQVQNQNQSGVSDANDKHKPFRCKECGKGFHDEDVLKKHMNIHSKDRKYVCGITGCDKRFECKKHRDRHEIAAHVPKEDRPDKIFCEICHKQIAHKWALPEHMKIHSDEKPFTCHLCGKSFKQERSLKAHLKSKLHGGQGLSYRNKPKPKKTTVPMKKGRKRKVAEKVEDTSDEEDDNDYKQEEESDEEPQTPSLMVHSGNYPLAQQSTLSNASVSSSANHFPLTIAHNVPATNSSVNVVHNMPILTLHDTYYTNIYNPGPS